jgi:hypothetical protein
MRFASHLLCLAAAFLLSASPALAAECYTRERVAEVLRQFGESPTNIGVAANGALLEIWTSPEGTWTAVIIHPNGQHCPVASGEGWTTRARTPQGVDG